MKFFSTVQNLVKNNYKNLNGKNLFMSFPNGLPKLSNRGKLNPYPTINGQVFDNVNIISKIKSKNRYHFTVRGQMNYQGIFNQCPKNIFMDKKDKNGFNVTSHISGNTDYAISTSGSSFVGRVYAFNNTLIAPFVSLANFKLFYPQIVVIQPELLGQGSYVNCNQVYYHKNGLDSIAPENAWEDEVAIFAPVSPRAQVGVRTVFGPFCLNNFVFNEMKVPAKLLQQSAEANVLFERSAKNYNELLISKHSKKNKKVSPRFFKEFVQNEVELQKKVIGYSQSVYAVAPNIDDLQVPRTFKFNADDLVNELEKHYGDQVEQEAVVPTFTK